MNLDTKIPICHGILACILLKHQTLYMPRARNAHESAHEVNSELKHRKNKNHRLDGWMVFAKCDKQSRMPYFLAYSSFLMYCGNCAFLRCGRGEEKRKTNMALNENQIHAHEIKIWTMQIRIILYRSFCCCAYANEFSSFVEFILICCFLFLWVSCCVYHRSQMKCCCLDGTFCYKRFVMLATYMVNCSGFIFQIWHYYYRSVPATNRTC